MAPSHPRITHHDRSPKCPIPVVVLPAVKQQSSAPGTTGIQLLDPEASLYGRIVTQTLRVDSDASVRGQELRDPGEMVQISTVIVEEEL